MKSGGRSDRRYSKTVILSSNFLMITIIIKMANNMSESSSFQVQSIGDHSRRPYRRIDREERKKLMTEVFVNHMTVAKASQKLGINNSTAKVIIRKYKNEHRLKRTGREGTPTEPLQAEQTPTEPQAASPQSELQICYVFVPVVSLVVSCQSGEHSLNLWLPSA